MAAREQMEVVAVVSCSVATVIIVALFMPGLWDVAQWFERKVSRVRRSGSGRARHRLAEAPEAPVDHEDDGSADPQGKEVQA